MISHINEITNEVLSAAKNTLGERLEKVVLFGSYARGDYDNESDVDIFILANIPQIEADKWRREIRNNMPDLDLEYDMVISLHISCTDIFNKYRQSLPFYQNVMNEGVEIYDRY